MCALTVQKEASWHGLQSKKRFQTDGGESRPKSLEVRRRLRSWRAASGRPFRNRVAARGKMSREGSKVRAGGCNQARNGPEKKESQGRIKGRAARAPKFASAGVGRSTHQPATSKGRWVGGTRQPPSGLRCWVGAFDESSGVLRQAAALNGERGAHPPPLMLHALPCPHARHAAGPSYVTRRPITG